MSETVLFLLIGMVNGWILRGLIVGWITRHAVSPTTREAMDRDIETSVARWFHRRPATK